MVDDNSSNEKIMDAEVVGTEPGTSASDLMSAETLDATQSLIVRLAQQLEDLEKDAKNVKDMLKNIFDNDEKLTEAQNIIDEKSKSAKARKTEIAASQQAVELKLKIGEYAEDIKMVKESLNTHLINYYKMTDSQTVDFPGGEEREFSIRASIKKGKKN